MKPSRNNDAFCGRWRIIETEVWDSDALDLIVPVHITFGADGLGDMEMIAIGASVDYRIVNRGRVQYVEFSWSGYDDSDRSCGRGWARLEGNLLKGEFFIHKGDDSTFIARRDTHPEQEGDRRRRAF